MLGGPDGLGNLFVFQAFGNELDDSVFTFTGGTAAIASCRHVCLRYNRVASLTRLIPPVMPKRKNSRLKCAFTVRRAMLSWVAISALSHPCKSNSTICCSRGPSRTVCSFIATPRFGYFPRPTERGWNLCQWCSTHVAISLSAAPVSLEGDFPQTLAEGQARLGPRTFAEMSLFPGFVPNTLGQSIARKTG